MRKTRLIKAWLRQRQRVEEKGKQALSTLADDIVYETDDTWHISNSDIVFGFLSTTHDFVSHFIEFVVLVMQILVLQLQVLKLFILAITITLKQVSQIIYPFTDLLVQLLELCLGALL